MELLHLLWTRAQAELLEEEVPFRISGGETLAKTSYKKKGFSSTFKN